MTETEALLQVLRRAIAQETAELGRLNTRLVAGYGDEGTRESLRAQSKAAQARLRAAEQARDRIERGEWKV
jgi:hypothetical protein